MDLERLCDTFFANLTTESPEVASARSSNSRLLHRSCFLAALSLFFSPCVHIDRIGIGGPLAVIVYGFGGPAEGRPWEWKFLQSKRSSGMHSPQHVTDPVLRISHHAHAHARTHAHTRTRTRTRAHTHTHTHTRTHAHTYTRTHTGRPLMAITTVITTCPP